MKKLALLLLLLSIPAWASYSPNTIITDPATPANQANVKAASTAAVATDKSLVVQVSPNTPAVPMLAGAGISASGSISASGTVFSQDCAQYQSASVQVTSIGAGNTINFQVSNDNVNWFNAAMMPAGDLTGILTTSVVAVGGYTTQLNSRYFRLQVTTYGSGTITANAFFKTFGNAPNSVGGYLSAQTLDGAGNLISSTANALWVAQQGSVTAKLNDGAGTSVTVGQKAMASSLPVTIASDQVAPKTYANANASTVQSTTIGNSSAVSFSAPAGAVGFIAEAPSANTQNLRCAAGTTATTALGLRLEPGRDTGFIPTSATVTCIAEAGTNQEVDIQWVSQ